MKAITTLFIVIIFALILSGSAFAGVGQFKHTGVGQFGVGQF